MCTHESLGGTRGKSLIRLGHERFYSDRDIYIGSCRKKGKFGRLIRGTRGSQAGDGVTDRKMDGMFGQCCVF